MRIGGVRVGIVKSVVPIQLDNGDGRGRALPQPRQERRTAAGRLDHDDPAQVGARPQVPPGHPGRVLAGASRPATRSRSPRHAGTGRHRPVLQHVRRAHPGRDPPEPGRLRQRPRRSRAAAERSDRRPQPGWSSTVSGRCGRSSSPAPTSPASGGRCEDLSATVAPVAETQASLFVALDRTFAAFARVSRPYIQETIEKGPATLDAVNADLPAMRPFFRDSARFFTALKPGAKALGETSPVIAAALHAGVPALNASPVLNDQLTADRGSPGRLPGSARRLQRPRPADRHQRTAEAVAALHRPGADHVQLHHPRLPATSPLSNSGGNDAGQLAQLRRLRAPEGPNSEGSPASAPANGPDRRQPPALQPLPEHRRAGPDATAVKPATRSTPKGQTVIGPAPEVFGETTPWAGRKMSRLPERDNQAVARRRSGASAGDPATPRSRSSSS